MHKRFLYFETLSLLSLLGTLWRDAKLRNSFIDRKVEVYYFDLSWVGRNLVLPLLKLAQIRIGPLAFQMRDVKDSRGELLRLRIFRADLFEIKRKILSTPAFHAIYQQAWKKGSALAYLEKGLIDGQIMDPFSASRLVFLISVVKWHADLSGLVTPILVVRHRPWYEVFSSYANEHGVFLFHVLAPLLILRRSISNVFYRFPRIYAFTRSVKDNGWPRFSSSNVVRKARIYVEGRGQVNLKNDGHHSDFYWLLNSQCSPSTVIYRPVLKVESEILLKGGIGIETSDLMSLISASELVPTKIPGPANFRPERVQMGELLASYNATFVYWRSIFKSNGVKIFLTWYRYVNAHIAVGDAIKHLGGVSVCLPIAFDGQRSTDLFSKFDITFCYSAFAADVERQSDVRSSYRIITGYTGDYAIPLLKAEATNLRNRLRAAGARKIVFVIDENSVDDSRWHTGHALQRENYSFILEQLLTTPWLGVVFKPKVARTLRRRLGPVADLLAAAESTGRCYVYEATSRDVTSASPLLAGLSADVCIHGHLCSGTAALECALAGLPTLLIDREGAPDSKFYELPRGKVVFRDWPEAIAALLDHFERPEGLPGFGDWSSVIDQFDPFRDGLAARRIGDFLSWLQQGFDLGLDREAVMARAAERYGREWGEDKVCFVPDLPLNRLGRSNSRAVSQDA